MRQGARRARELGAVAVDDIDIEIIRVRDGGACWICDEAVDRAAVFPDPLSETTDHVIPISLGGDHTPENIALAHLKCNVAKGNKILEKEPAWRGRSQSA
jgi:5-methylcytosine-specific restriction endonuclease McrA